MVACFTQSISCQLLAAPIRMSRCDLRIVVVDDNRDAAYTLALLLKRSGFSVVAQISDATTALECLKNERPDVVIMDIAMPKLDGYALARQIRAEISPALRLVALSGMCTAKDQHDAVQAGFDAHLAKPADWPVLEALLLSYLSPQTDAMPADMTAVGN
jgi:CheY-like chemotaxis protein